MLFRTEVELPPQSLRLTPRSGVMLAGSCFAGHIGRHMEESLPDGCVCTTPFGVCYNPLSVLETVAWAVSPHFDAGAGRMFLAADGLWHHWGCSTKLVAESRDSLCVLLETEWRRAQVVAGKLDALLLTFSTDHIYILKEARAEEAVVANCHKQPAGLFREEVAGAEEMFSRWCGLLAELKTARPGLQVVLTLSPYRYAKHGFHGSRLSKARLLMLIDRLCSQFEWVHYFPAYEIVLDELRDYRFYEADMLHPSAQAVDYVWERFRQWAFTPELCDYARDRQSLLRDLAHRPLHPGSEENRRFGQRVEERRRLFEKKWGEKL